MRQLSQRGVSHVVHDEGTVLLLLHDGVLGIGIGEARTRGDALVGIPEYALDVQARRIHLCLVRNGVRGAHVRVVVAIVAHKHDDILPRSGVFVFHVGNGLVDHDFGFRLVAHRETADGDVGKVVVDGVDAFAVVEIAEIAVIGVAENLAV